MSKIYSLIEQQINVLLGFIVQDDPMGEVQYLGWVRGPWAKPIITIITTLIYLLVVLAFGLYLWNYGLVPVFPNVIAAINPSNPAQATNPYSQLILTLLAIMMLV